MEIINVKETFTRTASFSFSFLGQQTTTFLTINFQVICKFDKNQQYFGRSIYHLSLFYSPSHSHSPLVFSSLHHRETRLYSDSAVLLIYSLAYYISLLNILWLCTHKIFSVSVPVLRLLFLLNILLSSVDALQVAVPLCSLVNCFSF